MGNCCSRVKKKEGDLNTSESIVHKINYDCRGFSLHDMSLLNKKHDPKGATAQTKYRYFGDVQLIAIDKLFKAPSIKADEDFSLNAPNIENTDEFRILFCKDYDDPFYLRLLETMTPMEDLEYAEMETQMGSHEPVKSPSPTKSPYLQKSSISEKRSSSSTKVAKSSASPSSQSQEKKPASRRKEGEIKKDKSAEIAVKPTQTSQSLRKSTTGGKAHGHEEMRTEPTMQDTDK
ncbi:unnamed protein product [Cylicocyclus nassatus]|uniref:Uncharacterized protein n=1 Tax=Cylicocyclus nassatus TaxID=53992 RepID=A0AA36M719_CYLNA|nr:unnamed protein product [Cylicocyclus nassatus]